MPAHSAVESCGEANGFFPNLAKSHVIFFSSEHTHVDRDRAANADLKKKLAEALEQQRATADGRHFQLGGGCAARNLQALLSRLSKICLSRRESAVNAPKFSCASMILVLLGELSCGAEVKCGHRRRRAGHNLSGWKQAEHSSRGAQNRPPNQGRPKHCCSLQISRSARPVPGPPPRLQ